jgi:SAM-dependent methyltransferase
MDRSPIAFDGSIPENYDRYLASFLFEPFAADLAGRIEVQAGSHLLELACGTGILTRRLANHLPTSAELITTDINEDMLAFAQEKITAPNILWDTVDMTAIPYADDLFDIVFCQFGLMFASDKSRAFAEIHRVLRKDGVLLFNVWADKADNPVWRINNSLIRSLFPDIPLNPDLGPFSLAVESISISLLHQAGFADVRQDSVRIIGVCESAAIVANGFTFGTPLYNFIKSDPALLEKFRHTLEDTVSSELGASPVQSPLRAWVFSAVK